MKIDVRLLGIMLLCVFAFSIVGCFLRREQDEPEEVTATVVSVNPASDSTISANATITVTFDNPPGDVTVIPGVVMGAGKIATITGPFETGALTLKIEWADGQHHLTYIVKADKPDIQPPPNGMVLVPAGEFEMGSNDEEANNDEQPVHTVYVDAFYMDEHEVTNLEYQKFVLENPHWQKEHLEKRLNIGRLYLSDWNGNNYPKGKADHPVTYVPWYAAMAYAQSVNKRLPTEAEWERAARGGLAGRKYPHGNAITADDANYGKNVGDTTPVGHYPANDYGLYDMAGNVWEWCLDKYRADFYSVSSGQNPLSSANSIEWIIDNFADVTGIIVMRGGSWLFNAQHARVSNRISRGPFFSQVDNGFRCVRAVTQ